MAHPNIDERREAVQKALGNDTKLSAPVLRQLAETYQCHIAAIRADIIALRYYDPTQPTYHITPKQRTEIRQRDNDICAYCGEHVDEPVIDHVVPVSMGGRSTADNLVVACQSCNMRKANQIGRPTFDNRPLAADNGDTVTMRR